MTRTLASILLLCAVCVGSLHAAPPPDENAAIEAAMKRLRDTLRTTMTQLQTAQAETAALQAEKVETSEKLLAQAATIEKLTKQQAADQTAAKKAAADAEAQIANKTQELARTNEALEKWKSGYKQAAQVANATEAKRQKLESKAVMLERTVTEQRTRNAELYKLGTEILTRYEKFGLGNVLLAREPFTGIAKVKFQTLIQDYQDKMEDQIIKPDADKAKAAAAKVAGEAKADDRAAATEKKPETSTAPVKATPEKLAPMPEKKEATATTTTKAKV